MDETLQIHVVTIFKADFGFMSNNSPNDIKKMFVNFVFVLILGNDFY